MNRKQLNRALITGVVILWVLIGNRVIHIVKPRIGTDGQVKTHDSTQVRVEDDTIRLLLNYRDPFMTLRSSTHFGERKVTNSATIMPEQVVKTVQQIKWPQVSLKGTVFSTDGTSKLALIAIESRLHIMHQGDVAEEVSLLKLESDSVTLEYKDQIKTIK